MSRRFALLVNPASAGGRALKALPKVHETLDGCGAEHRTVTTRSIDHAYEEALHASAEGETLVALGIHPQVVASISAPLDGGYGSRTVVFVPNHGRHIGFGHGTGVIVGHGPSVIVGHQPARGAGEAEPSPPRFVNGEPSSPTKSAVAIRSGTWKN